MYAREGLQDFQMDRSESDLLPRAAGGGGERLPNFFFNLNASNAPKSVTVQIFQEVLNFHHKFNGCNRISLRTIPRMYVYLYIYI